MHAMPDESERCHLAQVALNGFEFVLPLASPCRVVRLSAPLRQLPRHQGPIAGLLGVDGHSVPVVDLARWLPSLSASAVACDLASAGEGQMQPQLVAVLSDGGKRLGILLSRVGEVRSLPQAGVHLVHRNACAEELFDSVADWPLIAEGLPVLAVSRLMSLLNIWCEDDACRSGRADESTMQTKRPAPETGLPGLHVRAGSASIWLSARHLRTVLPAEALLGKNWAMRAHMPVGWWRGLPVPLVSLAASPHAMRQPFVVILGTPATGALGVLVESIEHLMSWHDERREMVHTPSGLLGAYDGVMLGADGSPIFRLDIDALLQAHPEAELAVEVERSQQATVAGPTRSVSLIDRPYIVFEAAGAHAIPAERVQEVVACEPENDEGIRWRNGWVPIVPIASWFEQMPQAQPEAARLAMIVHTQAGLRAFAISSLHSLVQSGQASLRRLSPAPNGRHCLLDVAAGGQPMLASIVEW